MPSIPKCKGSYSKLIFLSLLFVFIFAAVLARAHSTRQGRRTLVFEGKVAQLTVDLGGGSITNFHLRDQGLNPLKWGESGDSIGPRPMGHFLCLDRWGAPSETEQKNGMPFHGEAAHVDWQILRKPSANERMIYAEMAATLPLAGLQVQRRIDLAASNAYFIVNEEVTNLNRLGRIYNIVQHPTIGPPFLDENTVVDSNATRGFMQSAQMPNPEVPTVKWPEARQDGKVVNLRHLTNDPNPNVVSYTIDDEYGWVTAASPTKGLLIGYFWKSVEYPWFNAWRHVEKGKPLARGLEFGTTGLHQPFPILVSKGRIFGRPLYEFLDAGQTSSKSYICFLFKIPADYKGVASLTYRKNQLTLHERDARAKRNLMMEVGELFQPVDRKLVQ